MLTEEEQAFIHDTHFLLTKKKITFKIVSTLAEAEEKIKACLSRQAFQFPPNAFQKTGKISKGDNYRDLPYFVLDFPRLFSRQDTFSYRVMVRWGGELSFSLHLGGLSLEKYRDNLRSSVANCPDLYLCVNETPWEHHFENGNYRFVSELTKETIDAFLQRDFLKISIKHDLDMITDLPALAERYLIQYLAILE